MNSKPPWEEILRWLRFMGLQKAKKVIDDALKDDQDDKEKSKRIVYQLTDGKRSTNTISQYVDYSGTTVSNWQQEWSKLGIVSKNPETGSYQHLISLKDAGLECPEIPELE